MESGNDVLWPSVVFAGGKEFNEISSTGYILKWSSEIGMWQAVRLPIG
jgi:hypothetical protein